MKQETIGGLHPEYTTYPRQRCFVGHTHEAEWREDLLIACADVLPQLGLEPWYAEEHFDPTRPLRGKVVQAIANARYGIYDLSCWEDKQGLWCQPRNVLIELGMAIALNRPALLLRHSSNDSLPLPVCLQGVELLTFTGDYTLKTELKRRLPQWLDVPPDRDWLNRFCLFGQRTCHFREAHPRARQWGSSALRCHIADGLDRDHPAERAEIRAAFDEILGRYSDLSYGYLDELPSVEGYQFLLCSHCQTARSAPFAIYRITPHTPAEVFVAIGMSIALETIYEYAIPKVLLVRKEEELPSLLRGYEVVKAANSSEMKKKLKTIIPAMMKQAQATTWKPRALPFIDPIAITETAEKRSTATLVRILVVDDNPSMRSRLSNIFQSAGWEVSQAQTNDEALALLFKLTDGKFSLVTTDILRRPERSGEEGDRGLDFVREVNQRLPWLPVVVVTTYSPDWIQYQASGLHISEVLDKNWDDEQIVEKIRDVLKSQVLLGISQQSDEEALGNGINDTLWAFDDEFRRLNSNMSAFSDMEQALAVIMRYVQQLVSTEEASLLMVDDTTGDLVFAYTTRPAGNRMLGQRLPRNVGLAGYVATHGTSVIVNDARQDRGFYPTTGMETGFVTRAILTVPLHGVGGVQGVIEVLNRRDGDPFTEEDQRLLEQLADRAAPYLENARPLLLESSSEHLKQQDTLESNQLVVKSMEAQHDISNELNISNAFTETQQRVAYCYNCQPYEQGEPVWVLGKRYGTLRELFEDTYSNLYNMDAPSDAKISSMSCPNCGTELSEFSEVATAI